MIFLGNCVVLVPCCTSELMFTINTNTSWFYVKQLSCMHPVFAYTNTSRDKSKENFIVGNIINLRRLKIDVRLHNY